MATGLVRSKRQDCWLKTVAGQFESKDGIGGINVIGIKKFIEIRERFGHFGSWQYGRTKV